MKWPGIFGFEMGCQLRRPWVWAFSAVVLVLSFLMTRDGSVSGVLFAEYYLNSPFSIALTTVFGSLLWLALAASVAGEAAARDVESQMYALVYTAPIGKLEYLGGRFLAAWVVNAFILLFVQVGIALGVYLPGVDPALVGPFQPAAFLTAYGYISIPLAWAGTAIQFWLAARAGRVMAAYLGSFVLIFMGFFIASVLLFKRNLGTLLDPIGIRIVVEDMAHLWTPIEKNTRLLTLEGPFLMNRLLWSGVGILAIGVTVFSFRFAHRSEGRKRYGFGFRGRQKQAMNAPSSVRAVPLPASAPAIPDLPRSFGFQFQLQQTFAIARTSFRSMAVSGAGLVMLILLPVLVMLIVLDQMGVMGTPILPATARVTAELTSPLSDEMNRWVIIPFLIIYFAGELVWQERDAGMHELTDAIPGSAWPPLLGKLFALALLLAAFMTGLTAAGVGAQLLSGYLHFELSLYLKIMFGFQWTEYLIFAALALVIHMVVHQKYIGHLIAVLCFVFISVLAGMLGIAHRLLIYGSGPSWSYTEMTGFSDSVGPWLWFRAYWAAWALLWLVVARVLWVRGVRKSVSERIQLARWQFSRRTELVAGLALLLVLGSGGFIFYNTNILNPYLTLGDTKRLQAEYEQRYAKYAGTPQPQLKAANLHIDMLPDRRAVAIRGAYILVNAHQKAIRSIHLSTAVGGAETDAVQFNLPARLVTQDKAHGYRTYALEQPLEPGDTLRLHFTVRLERRGFAHAGNDPAVGERASYFTSEMLLPAVGYQPRRELITAADRRAHHLPPRPVIASLYEVEGHQPISGSGGAALEATIGTGKGQVAVGPGAFRRSWTRDNRTYFQYATDAPIGSEWAFFSAEFAVHEEKLPQPAGDIAIRIYHHPAHTGHVKRVAQSARTALAYYISQFGPYPHRHLHLVEHPGAKGTGGHSEAGLIYYGQGFEYWRPANGLDFPSFVIAHEVAHQWTVPYALVEGLSFLSEGLASYAALQAVKAARGEAQLGQLLQQLREHHPHAPIRRGEPLLRALDPYLAYRRGPFAMHALSTYIGSDRVNGALRVLIQKHRAPVARPATTLDLYRELNAVTPDSLRYLLHNLFEVNTYWDFKTKSVVAQRTESGQWEVTLQVSTRKTVYDSAGVVREPALQDWVQVGVYADGGNAGALSRPVYRQMHRVYSREQTITVTVPEKPARAGIDPHHLLDWEQGPGDNVKATEIIQTKASAQTRGD